MKTYILKVSTTFIRTESQFQAKSDRYAIAMLINEIENALINSGHLNPAETFRANVLYSLRKENNAVWTAQGCINDIVIEGDSDMTEMIASEE